MLSTLFLPAYIWNSQPYQISKTNLKLGEHFINKKRVNIVTDWSFGFACVGFYSVRFRKQNFIWLVLFYSGRTVKHHFGQSLGQQHKVKYVQTWQYRWYMHLVYYISTTTPKYPMKYHAYLYILVGYSAYQLCTSFKWKKWMFTLA